MNINTNVLGGLGLEKSEDCKPNLFEWLKEVQGVHFPRAEMNKLIMDYLITEGFKEAAEKFRGEASTEPHSAFDSLDERLKIREAVQSGNIEEAVTLTNFLNPEILDSRSHLYFHLQQQQLIELIRERKVEKALEFSQNVMAELSLENSQFLDELEKTMALLAYENPENSPFADLLNFSQRHKVASELNAAVLEADHQQTNSRLENLLKMLLWAQNELDEKKIKYPKMIDVANGIVQDSK
ncbi:glucose-induced degradation protein 8 homolog [Rhopilema esculentum]|uniref:glucose-induced degradation protein 8 homolog n=1 Tax=Rhopilema esculentum TaxID=499914 RepID=UPI0031DA293E|eukprot:gene13003-3771_t